MALPAAYPEPPAAVENKYTRGQRHLFTCCGTNHPKGICPAATPLPATPSPVRSPRALTLEIQRLEVPFTQVPNVLFELPRAYDLGASSQAVLMQVVRFSYGWHADDTGNRALGITTLARRANVSAHTVMRALADLEARHLLTRTRRTNAAGHRVPDRLTLTLPAHLDANLAPGR